MVQRSTSVISLPTQFSSVSSEGQVVNITLRFDKHWKSKSCTFQTQTKKLILPLL